MRAVRAATSGEIGLGEAERRQRVITKCKLGRKDGIKQLAASIEAHGLLQLRCFKTTNKSVKKTKSRDF